MGKHTEWRKLAKKARRKRVRQLIAQKRDRIEEEAQRRRESSPTYKNWLQEQKKAEEFQAEEEVRLSVERNAHWLKVEEEAQKRWQELQKKLELAREEKQKQNAKIKLEWEKEQQKLKELKEEKEKEVEIKRLEQEHLKQEIEDFIANGGDTPEHLKTLVETNPNKPVCPFFRKTFSCRFRDSCSRNHVRPGVSRILLIPNFYSHYSLEQSENEHGSDSSLEFESHELYNDFKEFFFDVVPELETCGRIIQFKVCSNHEAHLRGNVYVEYSQTREAVKGYRTFNGRYYGGKQLNVEFCNIESWKYAICGLFFQKMCPKGNACNFLHVFKNPNNLFPHFVRDRHRRNDESHSERRNWRWSESPERTDSNDNHYKDRHSDYDEDWEDYHTSRVSRSHTNGSSRRKSRTRSPKRKSSRRTKSRTKRSISKSRHRRSRSSSRSKKRRRSSSHDKVRSRNPSKSNSNSSRKTPRRQISETP